MRAWFITSGNTLSNLKSFDYIIIPYEDSGTTKRLTELRMLISVFRVN